MTQSDFLPLIVFVLFIASAASVFAAFKIYKDSRRQHLSKSVTVVICTLMVILFAFAALWAMLAQPR